MSEDNKNEDKKKDEKSISRREFLKIGSFSLAGLGIGSLFGNWINLDNGVIAIPASEGYLLVDTKKCQGCSTCMLTCSLAHYGRQNLSLGRIQVQQNSFKVFPNDLKLEQCRQCPTAPCVDVCPTGALHADEKNGNVRLVSPEKCIGCQMCMRACPYETSNVSWNHEDKHSQKCDLCLETPFWKEQGGPKGKQACVQVCPVNAIKFTSEIPVQAGDGAYKVNLRDKSWAAMGWPVE